MKSAIVFGARQSLGYELCVQLLEKGYKVYAKDFAQWQNEEQEEKWLFIGRNANLQYEHLEDFLETKQSESIHYFFIPLLDFYTRDFPEIYERFNQILKIIGKDDSLFTTQFIIIHPSAIQVRKSNFYSEIESFIKGIQEKGIKVTEYCVPVNKQDHFLLFTSNSQESWNEMKLTLSSTSIASEIIEYLEKNMFTTKT
ncbi:hypothetical protein KHA93_03290 [Bacillus sp. FJAT-49732]|uniref:Uncharacterized protein n=1 Tax=Lederbergia citrisecunda TaxID=2833583 RepID=A0A942TMN1_9BACI|nr:hypothetical protein [Lederbergia citrisecunda]MBS4198674.1 hypothetical protein [Lederbergia citrisecunda]